MSTKTKLLLPLLAILLLACGGLLGFGNDGGEAPPPAPAETVEEEPPAPAPPAEPPVESEPAPEAPPAEDPPPAEQVAQPAPPPEPPTDPLLSQATAVPLPDPSEASNIEADGDASSDFFFRAPIVTGTRYIGTLTSGDGDFYEFAVPANERIVVSVLNRADSQNSVEARLFRNANTVGLDELGNPTAVRVPPAESGSFNFVSTPGNPYLLQLSSVGEVPASYEFAILIDSSAGDPGAGADAGNTVDTATSVDPGVRYPARLEREDIDYYQLAIPANHDVSVTVVNQDSSANSVNVQLYRAGLPLESDGFGNETSSTIPQGTAGRLTFISTEGSPYLLAFNGAMIDYEFEIAITDLGGGDPGPGLDASNVVTAGTTIDLGSRYAGRLSPDDVDYYEFFVPANRRVFVTVVNQDSSGGSVDTRLFREGVALGSDGLGNETFITVAVGQAGSFNLISLESNLYVLGFSANEAAVDYNFEVILDSSPGDPGLGADASNSLQAPTRVDTGTMYAGSLDPEDLDYYGFTMMAGQPIVITVRNTTASAGTVQVALMYDGESWGTATISSQQEDTIRLIAPEDSRYELEFIGDGSSSLTYEFEIQAE